MLNYSTYFPNIIAVSKTFPMDEIKPLIDHGHIHFGENKVQELIHKSSQLSPLINWHFIGHLQSNKVTALLKIDPYLIHSVHSLNLARKISQTATALGIEAQILLQINSTREPTKQGLSENELLHDMDEFLSLPSLSLEGLMTMGPMQGNEKELRTCFASLRQLRDTIQTEWKLEQFKHLSMGMSSDFHYAILEGATLIRVGSHIFGPRMV